MNKDKTTGGDLKMDWKDQLPAPVYGVEECIVCEEVKMEDLPVMAGVIKAERGLCKECRKRLKTFLYG